MTTSNRIRLDDLRRMAVGDIAALPADQLVLLQDEADDSNRPSGSVRTLRGSSAGSATTMGSAMARIPRRSPAAPACTPHLSRAAGTAPATTGGSTLPISAEPAPAICSSPISSPAR